MNVTFLLVFISIVYVTVVSGQRCGQTSVPQRQNRKLDDGDRIVGGVEARPYSHPWIISMQENGGHFCGGSLVRVGNAEETDIVVTAAHCVYEGLGNNPTVTAGAHDLRRTGQYAQTARIKKALVYPDYNPKTTENDVAILVLKDKIRFTQYVQPICLPSSGESVSDGTQATVAGWGVMRENGDVSQLLNQVGVPIIDTRSCADAYGRKGIRIDGQAMICAGYRQGGKDACQGDSGGPFIVNKSGRYVLQGIVSFGIGCARPGLPGIYTRVSSFTDWIEQQISQNSRA